ncbi:TPA: hypothetical protein L7266_003297 [Escherichia coli]|nr:hypothetical protein [Escherichia coli]
MSTGLRFTLEVDGLPPDAFAVVSFHLNQSLSSLFSLDLSLVSQQFLSLEFQQILDKMAYLTIWQGDDVQRRVKGVVTEGGLTRSMGYDAAGRITVLTNENGSQSTFRYDPVDRLTEQRGFDGRTQRYHYDLTGKLTQSEDEGLITLWHYDASDRITRRTVNGDPAEQWQYDEHGWLTTISHTSDGHRVSVHYGYDDKGRLTGERQTVENPETGEMLWEHETGHAYSEQGLATRQEPDGLPPVEWLTYGSGYLAGMKLGGTPLVEYTRDRLHRETVRSFGSMAGSNAAYELTSTYTLTGQLQSRHLNLPQLDRDYDWNDNGQLIRISGPQESREYRYSDTGRLTGVHTTAANLDIDIPYATDPAGNRLPDPELHPDSTLTAWPDTGMMIPVG